MATRVQRRLVARRPRKASASMLHTSRETKSATVAVTQPAAKSKSTNTLVGPADLPEHVWRSDRENTYLAAPAGAVRYSLAPARGRRSRLTHRTRCRAEARRYKVHIKCETGASCARDERGAMLQTVAEVA